VLLVMLAALRRVRDPIAASATAGRPCQAAATAARPCQVAATAGRPCQAAEGLRRSIELVLSFAVLANFDPASTGRPRSILPDPAVLRTVPAIVLNVAALVETDHSAASAALPMPNTQAAARGRPTAIRVIALARRPDT
jgi:hypothetical protein